MRRAVIYTFVGDNAGVRAALAEQRDVANLGEASARILLGGAAGTVVAVFVLASILGTLNATVLVGPRIAYAMALDGLFFRGVDAGLIDGAAVNGSAQGVRWLASGVLRRFQSAAALPFTVPFRRSPVTVPPETSATVRAPVAMSFRNCAFTPAALVVPGRTL